MPDPSGPRLEVYQTDAEAYEAAAEVAAERLRDAAAARGSASIALAGGRGGRGVTVALATRGDLPWERVEWYWGDERCVPAEDKRSLVRQAEEDLLIPRGVAAARIHRPALGLEDPTRIAAAYAEALATALGAPPVFDVLLVDVTPTGQVAALGPGAAALGSAAWVTAVPADAVDAPPVARVSITPPVLAAARHVIVTVTGDEKAAVVAAALREAPDPLRRPVQLVLPSARVTWVVDRAAAAELLKGAVPAPQ
jgi:6-phosphogluconolactonase